MNTGKAIFFGLALIAASSISQAHASEYLVNLGQQKYFGSYEQLA